MCKNRSKNVEKRRENDKKLRVRTYDPSDDTAQFHVRAIVLQWNLHGVVFLRPYVRKYVRYVRTYVCTYLRMYVRT